ncbi:MAG: response regulator [Candidatus Hydrogenedentes bacterium]|nr:response regulator [Candidatus Hydrogenedentota bacterium]
MLTLILLMLPSLLWMKSKLEERLLQESVQGLERLNREWTGRLNEKFVAAKSSIVRFSGLVSGLPAEPVEARVRHFDSLVLPGADGAWRSDRENFDGTEEAGIWLQRGHPLTAARKSFLMAAKPLTEAFGKGALGAFADTWILPAEGGIVIYWPIEPEWIYGATADLDYTGLEWVTLTKPDNNADGGARWTSTSFDPAPKVWMISVVAPFYRGGAWAGAVGHDLPIDTLMGSVGEIEIYPGTRYMLVREDGAMLVSNTYYEKILEREGEFTLAETGDAELAASFAQFQGGTEPARSFDHQGGDALVVMSRVAEPGWYLITETPRAAMLGALRGTYRAMWQLQALILVFLGVLIPVLVSRMILPPVRRVVADARAVAGGALDHAFSPEWSAEFDSISRSIQTMVSNLKAAIRQAQDAETAARQSENHYRALVSNIPGAVYRCANGAARTMYYLSDEIEHLTGYPASSFLGGEPLSYGALIHPDDRADLLQEIERSTASGEPYAAKYRILHRDGTTRWVSERGRSTQDGQGAVRSLEGVIFDHTQQRRAEEALDAEHARFVTIMDALDALVYVADMETHELLFVNAYGRSVWAAAAGEKCWNVLQSEQNGPCSFCTNTRLMDAEGNPAGPLVWEFENTFNHEWYQCRDEAIRWPDGRIVRLEIATNITARKQAEEERLHLERQVQHAQKLESLGVLAGGIAHDFNNILVSILGYADLALQDLGNGGPAWEKVKEIEKGARRAAELATQMLAYSGRGRFEIAAIDVSEFVREMAKLLEVSISKKATLNYELAPGLPAIEGDATQIRQVIMNLITNASDALGTAGGVITLRTGMLPAAPRQDAGTEARGQCVYVDVADTGCGMDPATLERIFEPFFTTKFTGRGLGMAAVQGIVRGHQGSIECQSTPGAGTCFRLCFPASGKAGVRIGHLPMPENGAEGWRGSGTVLLVDDEASVRELCGMMLGRLGFQVIAASNGLEAVEALKAHREEIVCVILDLTMPQMDGEECFQALRLLRADLPVIMSSGYSEDDVTQRLLSQGVTGFIQKPYLCAALRDKVRAVLSG